MNKPNIFKFATKELSQDAFICWLLAWANKAHQDDELHSVGVRFLESLLAKKSLNSVQINSIEVRQQYKRIDILVLINTTLKAVRESNKPPEGSLAIIIEDKVGAGLTGNQLERYYKTVKNLGFSENQILPVYFRTKDKLDLSAIERNYYKAYMREDFLKVLQSYKGTNQVLKDFRTYWQQIEDDTNVFQDLDIGAWKNQAWIGFYKALRGSLGHGSNGNKNLFNTNSSPTYGPLFEQQKKDCKLYIRLCKDKLNFTVEANSKNTELIMKLRIKWLKALEKQEVGGFGKINKAKRVGISKAMTIGFIEKYVATKNGKVDVEETLSNLRSIEQFMKGLEVE